MAPLCSKRLNPESSQPIHLDLTTSPRDEPSSNQDVVNLTDNDAPALMPYQPRKRQAIGSGPLPLGALS